MIEIRDGNREEGSQSTTTEGMKSIKWLNKRSYPPNVYLFRHLERGSIVYSQTPYPTASDINTLWPQPNGTNKKPIYGSRRDLWKLMCFVKMPEYDQSNQLYRDMVYLRHMRDIKGVNVGDRVKNGMGQVWYSGQYRPVYGQEAVADLRECLLKRGSPAKEEEVVVYWEDIWRMGDESTYWTQLEKVKHKTVPRIGNTSREESEILKLLSSS